MLPLGTQVDTRTSEAGPSYFMACRCHAPRPLLPNTPEYDIGSPRTLLRCAICKVCSLPCYGWRERRLEQTDVAACDHAHAGATPLLLLPQKTSDNFTGPSCMPHGHETHVA